MHCGALIIDDHALFAGGMKLLLKSMEQFDWIEVAPTPAAAINTHGDKTVDLLIVDFFIPGFPFSEWTPRLKTRFQKAHLVGVSSSPSQSDRDLALDAGADMFFAKHEPPAKVLASLQALLKGDDASSKDELPGPAAAASEAGLSPRQIEILIRLARGHSTKDIAREFAISAETVKSHLSNIYQRTGAAGKSAAIQWARKIGLT